MSLREKAREIKAAGEAERGNFDPSGKPLDLYMQWRADRIRRFKDVTARENFCHFWRVVAIWVPLMKIRHGASAVAEHPAFGPVSLFLLAALAAVGLITGSVMSTAFFQALLIIIGLLYGACGMVFGGVLSQTDSTDDEYNFLKWASVATFPTALPVWAIGNIVKRIPDDVGETILGVVVGLVLAAFAVGLVVWAIQDLGWLWGIVTVLAVPAAIVAGVFACVLVADFLKGLMIRHETKVAAREAEYTGVSSTEPKEPGKVSKFFTAIADFIILVAQVVRTKKWKICPIVTIPQDNLIRNDSFEVKVGDSW